MDNKIFAFIGPHASGKSTLIRKLVAMGLPYIPAYTTAPPDRVNKSGNFYHSVSDEEFRKLNFVTRVSYRGFHFGMRKEDMLLALQRNRISLMSTEINGLKQITNLLKGRVESIYLMVDYMTLVERMLKAGESNVVIKSTLSYAETNGEFNNWKYADYVVKNTHDVDTALRQILAILGMVEPDEHAIRRAIVNPNGIPM